GWIRLGFGEMWEYRELLYFLVWRDIKVRYKQTALGVTWALIQPVLAMIVFTLIFGGHAATLGVRGTPYPLYVFSGLLPWQYFTSSVTGTGSSLLKNAALVSKVFFPRVLAPLSAAVVPLIDLAMGGVVLAGLFAWYQKLPPPQVLVLPVFVVLAL